MLPSGVGLQLPRPRFIQKTTEAKRERCLNICLFAIGPHPTPSPLLCTGGRRIGCHPSIPTKKGPAHPPAQLCSFRTGKDGLQVSLPPHPLPVPVAPDLSPPDRSPSHPPVRRPAQRSWLHKRRQTARNGHRPRSRRRMTVCRCVLRGRDWAHLRAPFRLSPYPLPFRSSHGTPPSFLAPCGTAPAVYLCPVFLLSSSLAFFTPFLRFPLCLCPSPRTPPSPPPDTG